MKKKQPKLNANATSHMLLKYNARGTTRRMLLKYNAWGTIAVFQVLAMQSVMRCTNKHVCSCSARDFQ